MERSLHEMGYKYTGSDNIYQLTWDEVNRITEGSELLKEHRENDNINDRDLETWEEFNKELENR